MRRRKDPTKFCLDCDIMYITYETNKNDYNESTEELMNDITRTKMMITIKNLFQKLARSFLLLQSSSCWAAITFQVGWHASNEKLEYKGHDLKPRGTCPHLSDTNQCLLVQVKGS